MAVIRLDPGDYDGTYKPVGGEVSLDLINTVSWPGLEREHDWLDRPGNVTAWARAVGLIAAATQHRLDERTAADPEASSDQLATIRRIRRTLAEALVPLARGSRPGGHVIEAVNRLADRTCGRRRIDPEALEWSWVEPERLTDLMAPVIWNALHVLTEVDRSRLGHCPACGWVFHDTTRNRSRRWCDMADCGSRQKSRRYYHRSKGAKRGGGANAGHH